FLSYALIFSLSPCLYLIHNAYPVFYVRVVAILTLKLDEICWCPVTPPKLSGDAPVLNILHPEMEPPRFSFRFDNDSAVEDSFVCGLGHVAHLHPPLRLEHWFNHVFGPLAYRNCH